MKIERIIKTLLLWLPSVMVSMIFIQNGLSKIFYADQMDKVISNKWLMISVGILLLIATSLFLVNRTMIWGTSLLVLYMTFIIFIHIYKEKPFEVAALIVLGTILSAYLRKSEVLKKESHP